MSNIRPLVPSKCPDCGAEASLFIDDDRRVTCRLCGYKEKPAQAKSSLPQPDKADPREQYVIQYTTSYTPDLDRWAEAKFSSAMAYAKRKEWEMAIASLEEAIDQQSDFIEAHLWLGRLHPEYDKREHHYQTVVAMLPNNIEATRELMVLRGELTQDEAQRASDMSREQVVMEAEHAVKTVLTEIVCRNCGGSLRVPEGQTEVQCEFCGQVETLEQTAASNIELLSVAMIKERGKGIKWRVGQHLLQCDNCGAQQVITKRQMNVECPFCGSDHVVKKDALDSFRQPDGIVPFQVKQKDARGFVDAELNSFMEKFKGIFINNRVDNIHLQPVYLPYWIFDVMAQITVTRTKKSETVNFFSREQPATFSDNIYDLPYCAVTSPPRSLTHRLKNFDMEQMQPYHPKRIANVLAELYAVDYQQAAIDIRPDVREVFRFRHEVKAIDDEKIRMSYMIQGMSFRLVLLPVWIATITEVDKDIRIGLVHGQTGQTVIGKAQKPQM